MITNKYKGLVVSLFALLALGAESAHATLMTTVVRDNDCVGYFGGTQGEGGFSACQIFGPDEPGLKISPVIIQFNGSLDGVSDINSEFTSITGDEWTFSNLVDDGDNKNVSGDWSYTPGDDDPGVRYWVAKAQDFTLFWEVADSALAAGGACTGDVFTKDCLDEALVVEAGSFTVPGGKGLSHLTFYDSEPVSSNGNGGGQEEVPEPGVLALLGMGLLAGLLARRRFIHQG